MTKQKVLQKYSKLEKHLTKTDTLFEDTEQKYKQSNGDLIPQPEKSFDIAKETGQVLRKY